MCCTDSAVYLAGWHVEESRKLNFQLKILHSEAYFLHLKQIIITKSKAPDIFTCRPSKYHVVVQESGSSSLQSPSTLAQWCSSGVANIIAGLNALDHFSFSFMCCWTVSCSK